MPTRREFLAAFRGGKPIAAVHARCLESRGVVCRACRDACDAGAIAFTPRPAPPRIDAALCTGCGQCVPVCPAGAIAIPAP